VTFTTPNGKVWTYRYDGAGRRIEKRSPTGDTWRYVWMGAVLMHTLKNDELAETYVHEPGGTCPILRDDGAVHFILPDQNDSPSEEVGADGKLEWTARGDEDRR
jgi:YD repeat-containing protein